MHMDKLAKEIIDRLKIIDCDSVNMDRKKIEEIIDELLERADVEKSEKWKAFLMSEKLFYNYQFEDSHTYNLKAYELDEEECKESGTLLNYYIVNSLAVSYFSMKDYMSALKYFSLAIGLNSSYMQSYIDRATVYRQLGKYESALQDSKYVQDNVQDNEELYYQAIESQGRTLIALGKYREANEMLIEIYDAKKEDAEYLEALAQSYFMVQNIERAKEFYDEALRKCTDTMYQKYIEIKLDALKETENVLFKKSILILPKEQQELIEKISNNNLIQQTMQQKYCEKYENEKGKRKWLNDNYIMCLKGWSSSTPEFSWMSTENNPKCGGGFYIRYCNHGIVIDPGINYMENLHRNNLFIQDIDLVIVTHNHIDHNADLLAILDMSYQTGKEIRYYLDAKTYEKCMKEIDEIEKQKSGLVKKIYPDASEQVKNINIPVDGAENIVLKICQTEHNCEGSFGFKLYLNEKIVGYTSDTKCTEPIIDFFKDVDFIIANVSATNEKDLVLAEQKQTHLGVTGTYKLLNAMEKDNVVCLLSEFWGGLGDIRLELVKTLKSYLSDKLVDIIPTDIGIVYFMLENTFLCSSCETKATRENVKFVRTNGRIKSICANCNY